MHSFLVLYISPVDNKNYCDRADQSMKLGMQVLLGIYNKTRRGAKNNFIPIKNKEVLNF